jgi:hypothetical protein
MSRAVVGALHDDHAVMRGENAGVIAHLPTVETFAVKKAHEPFLRRRRLGRTWNRGQQRQQGGDKEENVSFQIHGARTVPEFGQICQARRYIRALAAAINSGNKSGVQANQPHTPPRI